MSESLAKYLPTSMQESFGAVAAETGYGVSQHLVHLIVTDRIWRWVQP